MAKKIYDIKPPKTAHKKEKIRKEPKVFSDEVKIKKSVTRSVKDEPLITPHYHKKQEHQEYSVWQSVLVAVLVVVVAVGVYLFFKLPKAEIVLWPKIDTMSFKQTITADKSAGSVNVAKDVIPAQYFQATKTSVQEFPATGSASNDGKASGTITIYNKVDPPTQFTLRAGTHFMSDSGKLFIALQKVVIPAAKKSGRSITPGSVQVNVQAVESGIGYNIAPSNFSIPGLKGTSSYYSIYATSSAAMSGGYTGKVKKVTDDDIQGAKDVLTKKATAEATASLKSQISSDYILLDNALLSNVTDASTKTKSGTIADNFSYQVVVTASALAFKKSDIDQFVKNYVISQIPQERVLLENSSTVNYSSSVVDISGGKATLNLDFSAGVYQNIDKNSLALSLLRENASQVNQTIKSALGDNVSKIKINFWPFWVYSVPNNQKVVTLQLEFK